MRFHVYARFHYVLLFLAACVVCAHGEIRESKDWIVNESTHKVLTTLATELRFHDTELRKGHAVVWLSTTGCNVRLVVVGPPSGDARRYAKIIDYWRARQGWSGDVLWSQEDDSASADFHYQPGHFGMTHATTAVDLDQLKAAMASVESNVELAVSDPKWSNAQLPFAPDYTAGNGTRYWNLSRKHATLGVAIGSITLAPWLPWMMLFWLLVPPFGIVAGLFVGAATARNENIPFATRRTLYWKVALRIAFVSIAVPEFLVIVCMFTKVLEPVGQLWSGQPFMLIGFGSVSVSILWMLLLYFPFVTHFEKRMAAPTAEESSQPAFAPLRKVATSRRKLFTGLLLAVFVVGFALTMWTQHIGRKAPNYELEKMLGWFLTYAPLIVSIFYSQSAKFKVEPVIESALTEKLGFAVTAMSERLGMASPPYRVLTQVSYGRFSAVSDRKGLGVTVHALETLPPAQIDFLVAHELAHIKLRHRQRRNLFALLPVFVVWLLAMIPLTLSTIHHIGGELKWSLLPFTLVIPWWFVMDRVIRKQEFEADRVAIATTGDPDAAIATLRTLTENPANQSIRDSNFSKLSSIQARIGQIRGQV